MAEINFDDEVWAMLAKFNLVWATVFWAIYLIASTVSPDRTLLILENGLLAGVFGFIQTYCWLSR